MKLSDRDLKLIIFVLLAAIIVLPIFFVIRPFNEKIDSTTSHINQLKEREDFLAKLDANREFYNTSIVLLDGERTKIIADYAEGLIDENNVFFLAKAEKDLNLAMTTLNFAYAEPTTISDSYINTDGETVEGLTALTSLSTIEYVSRYEDMKSLLQFVLDAKDRMVITSLSADQDDETGLIKGVFILNQYAVTGEGRSLAPAGAESIPYGIDNIFGKPSGEVA